LSKWLLGSGQVFSRGGADIHAENDLALIWACHLEVAKFLMEKGASIYADNDGAL